MVSFDVGKKKGHVYFGAYPVHRLRRADKYARVRGVNRKWMLNVDSIDLGAGAGDATTPLFQISSTFKISLSSKTIQLPREAIKSLESILRGSKLQQFG